MTVLGFQASGQQAELQGKAELGTGQVAGVWDGLKGRVSQGGGHKVTPCDTAGALQPIPNSLLTTFLFSFGFRGEGGNGGKEKMEGRSKSYQPTKQPTKPPS